MALDTESFDILLATVQRFIRERLMPAENHLEEHDEVPPELVEAIRPGGLAQQKAPRIQASLRFIREERGDHSLEFLAELPPLDPID